MIHGMVAMREVWLWCQGGSSWHWARPGGGGGGGSMGLVQPYQTGSGMVRYQDFILYLVRGLPLHWNIVYCSPDFVSRVGGSLCSCSSSFLLQGEVARVPLPPLVGVLLWQRGGKQSSYGWKLSGCTFRVTFSQFSW